MLSGSDHHGLGQVFEMRIPGEYFDGPGSGCCQDESVGQAETRFPLSHLCVDFSSHLGQFLGDRCHCGVFFNGPRGRVGVFALSEELAHHLGGGYATGEGCLAGVFNYVSYLETSGRRSEVFYPGVGVHDISSRGPASLPSG